MGHHCQDGGDVVNDYFFISSPKQWVKNIRARNITKKALMPLKVKTSYQSKPRDYLQ